MDLCVSFPYQTSVHHHHAQTLLYDLQANADKDNFVLRLIVVLTVLTMQKVVYIICKEVFGFFEFQVQTPRN